MHLRMRAYVSGRRVLLMRLTHSLHLVPISRCLLTTWKPGFEKVLTKLFYGFMVDF